MATNDRFFFERYGLSQRDLERYLAEALSAGGDYADLYFEHTTSTSLLIDESLIKSAQEGISVGCGVRVLAGEQTGYAYTDDLSPEKILKAARTAARIASGPASVSTVGFRASRCRRIFTPSPCRQLTAPFVTSWNWSDVPTSLRGRTIPELRRSG